MTQVPVPIDDDVIAEVTFWIKGHGHKHVRLYEYPDEEEGPYLIEEGADNNYDSDWDQDEVTAKASLIDLARDHLNRFERRLLDE